MAHFKKFTQPEVYNELQHNARRSCTRLSYNLAPHRDISDYQYFEQRKSELYCMNRADVKVLIDWIVIAPKDLNPSEETNFFKVTYQFLEDRYGAENVIQAYVHCKEGKMVQKIDWDKNPEEIIIGRSHLHFCFIPATPDTNPNHPQAEKICADKVLGADLYSIHPDLQQYLSNHGISAAIMARTAQNYT